MGEGQKLTWSGTRAPSLRRTGQPAWGQPMTLFSGKSLDGWQPVGRRDNQWSAVGGILQNANSGANLVTSNTSGMDDGDIVLLFPSPCSVSTVGLLFVCVESGSLDVPVSHLNVYPVVQYSGFWIAVSIAVVHHICLVRASPVSQG